MRTLSNSAVFFASFVVFLFMMLPFCEAEVISVNSGMQNFKSPFAARTIAQPVQAEQKAEAVMAVSSPTLPPPISPSAKTLSAKNIAYDSNGIPLGSRMEAISAMSFIQAPIDPITKEKMVAAGYVIPPPSPAPVMISVPVPPVPDVYPMTVDAAKQFAAEVETSLSATEEGRAVLARKNDAATTASSILSRMNKEQNVFDTPAVMSNVDPNAQCIMPGMPGAEISGAGYDTESTGESAVTSAEANSASPGGSRPGRPSGGPGVPGEMLTGPESFKRGGGGGDDNEPGAAYANAKARGEYLDKISVWAQETYQQGSATASIFEQMAGDSKIASGLGGELGSADYWNAIGEGLTNAFDGLQETIDLYKQGMDTFTKLTNAVQDKSGNGAGSMIYNYEGVRASCGGNADCTGVESYYNRQASNAAELENIKAKLKDPKLSAEEKSKYEAALQQAEWKVNAFSSGTIKQDLMDEVNNQGKQLISLQKQKDSISKDMQTTDSSYASLLQQQADLQKKYSGSYEGIIENIKMNTELLEKQTNPDDKQKTQEIIDKGKAAKAEYEALNKQIEEKENQNPQMAELNKKLSDAEHKQSSAQKELNAIPDKSATQNWLNNKAKEFGLQTAEDAEFYMGMQAFDNKLGDLIGTPGTHYQGFEVDQPATGTFKSLEDLKKTFDVLKDTMDPEQRKQTEKEIKDYEERLGDGNSNTPAKKGSLEKDQEDLKKMEDDAKKTVEPDGKTFSKKEMKKIKEKQAEINAKTQALIADIAKSFKELITGATKGMNDKLKDLEGKIKDAFGEEPSAPCSPKPEPPCGGCPKDIYGKDLADFDYAMGQITSGSPAPPTPAPPAPPGVAPVPGQAPTPSPSPQVPYPTPNPNPSSAPVPHPVIPAGPSLPSSLFFISGLFSLATDKITGFAETGFGGVPAGGSTPAPGPMGDGDMGAGPAGPSSGTGSTSQCIAASTCFTFPAPEPGAGGAAGGADRRKGGVPAGLEGETGEGGAAARGGGQPPLDIQMGAGEGSPEAVVVEECPGGECVIAAPDPTVPVPDPVPQGAADVDIAQSNSNEAVTAAAANHGLTPVPGLTGVYQDSTGTQYVPDSEGVGFVARTESGQNANTQAESDLTAARNELNNAISTGNPPAVSVAQTNLNNAQTKYDATVSIKYSSKEQGDIQLTNLNLIDKTLQSIKTNIEQTYPNPKDRSPELQKAYFDAINHQLIVKLAEIQLKHQNSGSFEMYAEMQKEYEKLIDGNSKEGKAISGKEAEIKTDITNLMNNLNYFSTILNEKLNKANAVEKEYKWKIDQQKNKLAAQKTRYTELNILRERGMNSQFPNLEKDFSDALQKSMDAENAIKGMVAEANAQLKENRQAVEKARDGINAARDDLLKKYNELAKMKLDAPGLKEHFSDDKGALSKKGQQFKELKAAEKAALMDKFNKNSQKALMDFMGQLSGAAGAKAGADQTVAAQATPVSTSIPDFPVEFDLAGNLINVPLASLFPGDATVAMANAKQRSKVSLEVQESMGEFNDVRKAMKVKGKKFMEAGKVLSRLSGIQQAIDSGAVPPQYMDAMNDPEKWSDKNAAKNSMKPKQAASSSAKSSPARPSSPAGPQNRPAQGQSAPSVALPSMPTGGVVAVTGADAVATGSDVGKAVLTGIQVAGAMGWNLMQFVGYGVATPFSQTARDKFKPMSEQEWRQRVDASVNYKNILKDDLAYMKKQVADIKTDIEAEIKQSGFNVDYQVKALLWDARQISDADFLESLTHAKDALTEIDANLRQGIRNYQNERTAVSEELQAEENARLEECGADETCKHKVRLEFNAKFDSLKKYDEKIAELQAKLDGFKKSKDYVKAIEEINQLKTDAERRIVNDAVKKAEDEFKIANGQLADVIKTDEEWGLKSLSVWDEMVFEKEDVMAKQETAWLMEDLKNGAAAFKQLLNTLESNGYHLDALLRDESWKNVNPNDENSVGQWVENLNKELGLQGENKISVSALDEKNLALYWQTFGNGMARMVEGTYDPADTALGYLIIGNMKKEYGDLDGAINDFNTAKDIAGTSIIGGYVGEGARIAGAETEGDNFERILRRTIVTTVVDPLNVATLGIGAGVSLIKAGSRLLRVSERLSDLAQMASTVAKTTKTVLSKVPVLGTAVNVAGDLGSKVIGKVDDLIRGESATVKGMRNLMDDVMRNQRAAESSGDAARASQLAQQADDISKGINSLNGGKKAAGWFSGVSAESKGAASSLVKKAEDAWKEVVNAGKGGSADDIAKGLKQAKEAGEQLDTIGAAGKLLKEKPAKGLWGVLGKEIDIFGGNAPRKVLQDLSSKGDDVNNALKNFNNAVLRGTDTKGAFNSLQSSMKAFEDVKNVKAANKYMGWGYQSWRGFKENVNYFGESAGLIKPSETVNKARNQIVSAETLLKDALQTGKTDDISRAWTRLDQANNWASRARGTARAEQAVARGRQAMGEAPAPPARPFERAPVVEQPAPVAKLRTPADSANEVRRTVDSATPAQLRANAAADERAASRLSGRAAENAQNRAEELKQAAARKEAGVAVAEVKKPVPKPSIEAPTPGIVEVKVPAGRMTPEEIRKGIINDAGFNLETGKTYQYQGKFITKEKASELKAQGLGGDVKETDFSRLRDIKTGQVSSRTPEQLDELVRARTETRMNEFLKADSKPMNELAQKRGFVSAEFDETTGSYKFKDAKGNFKSSDELYNEYSAARSKAYSEMNKAKSAKNKALKANNPSEAAKYEAMEKEKLFEVNKYDGYRDNLGSTERKAIENGLDASASKNTGITKTDRGYIRNNEVIPDDEAEKLLAQSKYEEASKLYEGQQLRMQKLQQEARDLRSKAGDLRSKGNIAEANKLETDAKNLNTKYQRLSNDNDVLFKTRETSYKSVLEDINVPDEGLRVDDIADVNRLPDVVDAEKSADVAEGKILVDGSEEYQFLNNDGARAILKNDIPKKISPCTKCVLGSEAAETGKAKAQLIDVLNSKRIEFQQKHGALIPDEQWDAFVNKFSDQYASQVSKTPEVNRQAAITELTDALKDKIITKEEAARLKQVKAVNDLGPQNKVVSDAVDAISAKAKGIAPKVEAPSPIARAPAPGFVEPKVPVVPKEVPKPKTLEQLNADLDEASTRWEKMYDTYNKNPTPENLKAVEDAAADHARIEGEIKTLPKELPKPIAQQADSYKSINSKFEASKRKMNAVKNTDPEYGAVRNKYVEDLRAQSKELDNHLAMYPDDADAIKLKESVDKQVVLWTPKKAAAPVVAPKPVSGIVEVKAPAKPVWRGPQNAVEVNKQIDENKVAFRIYSGWSGFRTEASQSDIGAWIGAKMDLGSALKDDTPLHSFYEHALGKRATFVTYGDSSYLLGRSPDAGDIVAGLGKNEKSYAMSIVTGLTSPDPKGRASGTVFTLHSSEDNIIAIKNLLETDPNQAKAIIGKLIDKSKAPAKDREAIKEFLGSINAPPKKTWTFDEFDQFYSKFSAYEQDMKAQGKIGKNVNADVTKFINDMDKENLAAKNADELKIIGGKNVIPSAEQRKIVGQAQSKLTGEQLAAVESDMGNALADMGVPNAKALGKRATQVTDDLCSCAATLDGLKAKIKEKLNVEFAGEAGISDNILDNTATAVMESRAKQYRIGVQYVQEVFQDGKITSDEAPVLALGRAMLKSHIEQGGESVEDADRLLRATIDPKDLAALSKEYESNIKIMAYDMKNPEFQSMMKNNEFADINDFKKWVQGKSQELAEDALLRNPLSKAKGEVTDVVNAKINMLKRLDPPKPILSSAESESIVDNFLKKVFSKDDVKSAEIIDSMRANLAQKTGKKLASPTAALEQAKAEAAAKVASKAPEPAVVPETTQFGIRRAETPAPEAPAAVGIGEVPVLKIDVPILKGESSRKPIITNALEKHGADDIGGGFGQALKEILEKKTGMKLNSVINSKSDIDIFDENGQKILSIVSNYESRPILHRGATVMTPPTIYLSNIVSPVEGKGIAGEAIAVWQEYFLNYAKMFSAEDWAKGKDPIFKKYWDIYRFRTEAFAQHPSSQALFQKVGLYPSAKLVENPPLAKVYEFMGMKKMNQYWMGISSDVLKYPSGLHMTGFLDVGDNLGAALTDINKLQGEGYSVLYLKRMGLNTDQIKTVLKEQLLLPEEDISRYFTKADQALDGVIAQGRADLKETVSIYATDISEAEQRGDIASANIIKEKYKTQDSAYNYKLKELAGWQEEFKTASVPVPSVVPDTSTTTVVAPSAAAG